mmetsp:Transcript_82778/g.165204  ORF Transcript_82778/g.165204 Transcript_82778/m.165204 type:complete len:273 (-) Transcript_82778:98-916(-)
MGGSCRGACCVCVYKRSSSPRRCSLDSWAISRQPRSCSSSSLRRSRSLAADFAGEPYIFSDRSSSCASSRAFSSLSIVISSSRTAPLDATVDLLAAPSACSSHSSKLRVSTAAHTRACASEYAAECSSACILASGPSAALAPSSVSLGLGTTAASRAAAISLADNIRAAASTRRPEGEDRSRVLAKPGSPSIWSISIITCLRSACREALVAWSAMASASLSSTCRSSELTTDCSSITSSLPLSRSSATCRPRSASCCVPRPRSATRSSVRFM